MSSTFVACRRNRWSRARLASWVATRVSTSMTFVVTSSELRSARSVRPISPSSLITVAKDGSGTRSTSAERSGRPSLSLTVSSVAR